MTIHRAAMGQTRDDGGKAWLMGHNRSRLPVESSEDELCHLTEIALALETWPARNPVMRAALDRARDEVLQLARQVALVP